MNYNHQAAMRSLRGAQNRKEGECFEGLIDAACDIYKSEHLADIEKTPEPMKILRRMEEGKFVACFKKSAQPDYKGTLMGGRSICFDAKATCTGKIPVSALTDEQIDSLTEHTHLGALTGVLLCFDFHTFAWIPFDLFMRAKELNGHKHWTVGETEKYRVNIKDGYLNFLENPDFVAYAMQQYLKKAMMEA